MIPVVLAVLFVLGMFGFFGGFALLGTGVAAESTPVFVVGGVVFGGGILSLLSFGGTLIYIVASAIQAYAG